MSRQCRISIEPAEGGILDEASLTASPPRRPSYPAKASPSDRDSSVREFSLVRESELPLPGTAAETSAWCAAMPIRDLPRENGPSLRVRKRDPPFRPRFARAVPEKPDVLSIRHARQPAESVE